MRKLTTALASAGLAATILAGSWTTPASSAANDRLERWLERSARPTAALDHAVGDAVVVGLGEAVHGAHEIAGLKLRATQRLVIREGFRSVAWEEDWTTGRALDRYVTGGPGRLGRLARRMTGQWQSRETVRTLRWLRAFNADHADDPVRFVGVEYYYTGRSAYHAVRRYVARHAPRLLSALRADYRVIYPDLTDAVAYAAEYAAEPNKAPYVRRARHLARVVARIPHAPGDRAYALARQHVRQIVSFHEHYALEMQAQDDYREARAARTLRWWQRRTGDRVVYWAATPHTAAARHLRIALPGMSDFTYRATGSYLRQWYGPRYVPVTFTFDHGRVGLPGEVMAQPPAQREWFEAPLSDVARQRFLVDLRAAVTPVAVRRWLDERLTTRGMPWAPGSTVTGGTASRWLDLVVHVQRVTPQRGL